MRTLTAVVSLSISMFSSAIAAEPLGFGEKGLIFETEKVVVRNPDPIIIREPHSLSFELEYGESCTIAYRGRYEVLGQLPRGEKVLTYTASPTRNDDCPTGTIFVVDDTWLIKRQRENENRDSVREILKKRQ